MHELAPLLLLLQKLLLLLLLLLLLIPSLPFRLSYCHKMQSSYFWPAKVTRQNSKVTRHCTSPEGGPSHARQPESAAAAFLQEKYLV
jgi:hypothetical protein